MGSESFLGFPFLREGVYPDKFPCSTGIGSCHCCQLFPRAGAPRHTEKRPFPGFSLRNVGCSPNEYSQSSLLSSLCYGRIPEMGNGAGFLVWGCGITPSGMWDVLRSRFLHLNHGNFPFQKKTNGAPNGFYAEIDWDRYVSAPRSFPASSCIPRESQAVPTRIWGFLGDLSCVQTPVPYPQLNQNSQALSWPAGCCSLSRGNLGL